MTKEALMQLREVHAIQGRDGCWDIDDYMLGFYNGLELALSIAENRACKYKQRPKAQPEQEPVCDKDPQGCWNVRCQLGNKCRNTSLQPREVVANWIMDKGFATGHGDSIVDLLDQLEWQIAEKEREAIAQMFEDAPALVEFAQNDKGGCLVCGFTPKHAAAVIRARGEA